MPPLMQTGNTLRLTHASWRRHQLTKACSDGMSLPEEVNLIADASEIILQLEQMINIFQYLLLNVESMQKAR